LLKTKSLLDALSEGGFDAAFGGARRDEEKSRAKERIYSFRDSLGQWDPKTRMLSPYPGASEDIPQFRLWFLGSHWPRESRRSRFVPSRVIFFVAACSAEGRVETAFGQGIQKAFRLEQSAAL